MTRPSRVRFLSVLVGAGLVTAFLVPLAAAAETGIMPSPTEAVRGATVRVTGSGFVADEAVDVYFDTTDLALGVVGSGGRFPAVELTVPARAHVGTHWISAVGRLSHRAVRTPFDVVPSSWGNWAQGGADEEHTGVQPSEGALNRTSVDGLGRLWSTGVAADGSTLVLGRVLVTTGWGGEEAASVYAFDSWTGTDLWSVGGFDGAPPVAGWNGLLIVQAGRQLRAYDPVSGTLRWSHAVGPPRTRSWGDLTIAGDVAYVRANDERWERPAVVTAFDLRTQRELWTTEPLLGPKDSSAQRLVVTDGIVVIAVDQGLVGVEASSGVVRWTRPWMLGWSEGLSARDGTVYTSSLSQHAVIAVSAATGATRWLAPLTPGMYTASAAADGSRCYLSVGPVDEATMQWSLRAYDAGAGTLAWERMAAHQLGPPTVANGLLYALGGHELLVVDATTGAVVARDEMAADVWDQPAVANATLYVPTYDRGVIAMRVPGAPRPEVSSLEPDPALVPGPTQPVAPMTEGWSEGTAVDASLGASVASAVEFDDILYLGTDAGTTRTASILSSTDGMAFSPAARFPAASTVRLAVFDGRLFAATTSPNGASLYVSTDGTAYELVRSFAPTPILQMTPIAWDDQLVVAADTGQGPSVWTSTDGEAFAEATPSAQAPGTRFVVDPLDGGAVVFDGALYLGATSPRGGELWRVTDGSALERVALRGLGRPANLRAHAAAGVRRPALRGGERLGGARDLPHRRRDWVHEECHGRFRCGTGSQRDRDARRGRRPARARQLEPRSATSRRPRADRGRAQSRPPGAHVLRRPQLGAHGGADLRGPARLGGGAVRPGRLALPGRHEPP